MDCYIASGWFNKNQLDDLNTIKEALSSLNILYYSPKDELECLPISSHIDRVNIFNTNTKEIKKSKFLIVSTRDKDMGTIFEAGFAYANSIPIIYYYKNNAALNNFNLMLAISSIAVTNNKESLKAAIKSFLNNNNFKEIFRGEIE